MRIDGLTAVPPRPVTPLDAAKGVVEPSAASGVAAAHRADGSFAAMLGQGIAGLAHQLAEAEAISVAGIKGAASTQDVVEKVISAEQTLQASIAVRDKIVAAYLEISRMAI